MVKYNDGSLKKIYFSSNSYTKSPRIDKNKTFDFNYLNNLVYTYFIQIVYNPYRNEYYRVAMHLNETINKMPYSKPWSLIVADSSFRIKYEVNFNGNRYIYNKIIPTKNGFAVPILPNDLEEKNEIKLQEFELY